MIRSSQLHQSKPNIRSVASSLCSVFLNSNVCQDLSVHVKWHINEIGICADFCACCLPRSRYAVAPALARQMCDKNVVQILHKNLSRMRTL